jgi:hypothetical protein
MYILCLQSTHSPENHLEAEIWNTIS